MVEGSVQCSFPCTFFFYQILSELNVQKFPTGFNGKCPAYLCLFISPCDNVSNSSQCRCLNKKKKFDTVEGHITVLLNLNFKMQQVFLFLPL